jgi:hypothetical protein
MGSFLAILIPCASNRKPADITPPKILVITMAWLIPFVSCQTVFAQETIRVVGTVVNSQNQSPVPFVHVYTTSYHHGTISDGAGQFELNFAKPDTLIFSCVGYESKRIAFSAEDKGRVHEIRVELNPRTYQLDSVQVTAYPTIEQFKQDVLKLELAEKEVFKLNIPKGARLPPEGPDDVNLNPSISVNGVIGTLYDALSREGKEKKKVRAMHQQAHDFRAIDAKYNVEIVRNVTHLDEEAAKRFMEWCKFEYDFILNSSEYELAVAMLKCLDEFNKADTLR